MTHSLLTDDEAIAAAWRDGTERERDLARRLERYKAQVAELVRSYEEDKPGEPYIADSDCMLHKRQAD